MNLQRKRFAAPLSPVLVVLIAMAPSTSDSGEGPTMDAYDPRSHRNDIYIGQPDVGSPPSDYGTPSPYSDTSISELREQRDDAYSKFLQLQEDPRVNTDPDLRNQAHYWYNQYLLYDRKLRAR